MNNRLVNLIATTLLVFVFLITFFSMKGDSLTMDELAHLPAGYSYLTQKDMRLNPEHPPLVKDLAAFPLLFIKNIEFSSTIKAWKEDVNGQWDFGNQFLFKSSNPADQMIFWGRMPMILLLLLLGFYIFKFSKNFFGEKAALLALFLFSFSPTFLAHGRLVTTDVGAAFGVVFASYYFFKFLKNNTKKNLVMAGLALGIAELLKFSLILLIPFFAILILFWAIKQSDNLKSFLKIFALFALRFLLILAIAYLLVGAFYLYHTLNYPPEKQASDTLFTLSSFGTRPIADLLVWMADKPILKAYAQYGLGLAMVFQRATGGNTTYFLGEISAAGWKAYFPIVYLLKEPLPFHILTLIALIFSLWRIKRIKFFKKFLQNHFLEFAVILFTAFYWATSLKSNLNIGVRHLLPVFPFTIILVSLTIMKLLKNPYLKAKYAILGALIIWQAASVISTYPSFLAYFNESIGGSVNGYKYVADSNLDWGQDLKRLKKWIDNNEIEKIYVDYFGGSDVNYYLKEKYAPWWGDRDPSNLPRGSYLAVSGTLLQGGRGKQAKGYDRPIDYYRWLDNYQPVSVIGHSIFVYKIR